MTDATTPAPNPATLETLQRAIPLLFAPGLTKLCRPSTAGHHHGQKECPTPGKRPLFRAFNTDALARYQRAAESKFDSWAWADEVARWLDAGFNIGLVPPLGVVVLDCDNAATCAWVESLIDRALDGKTDGPLPAIQRRGDEKGHYWFRYDPDSLPLRAAALRFMLPDGSAGSMELRVGGRSQVVVAPSRHLAEFATPPGPGYAWTIALPSESFEELLEAPPALVRMLELQLGLGGPGSRKGLLYVPKANPGHRAGVADERDEESPEEPLLVAPDPTAARDTPGHDLLRGYVNRLCRYASDQTADGPERALAAIRERAELYARDLLSARPDGRARLAGLLVEGGELDRLISTGWARFGGAAPLSEDKTDQGCLDLLAATSGEDWRYLVQSGEWILWDTARGHWTRGYSEMLGRSIGQLSEVLFDDGLREQDVTRRARLLDLARLLRNNGRVESALRRAAKVYAVDETQCDALPWLVTFPGGWLEPAGTREGDGAPVWHPARVLDLETGSVRDPARGDLLTRAMGAPWQEGASSRDWDTFLASTVPDTDLRAYISRAAGMTLAGCVLEHVFLFLHGPGGTGKSTLLNALADAMGDLAVRCDVKTFAEDSRRSAGAASPDVARLKGARLAVCSEIPDRARLGSRMKDLTGGDRILARMIFGKPLEFTPSHTVWVAGNCEPQADWMDSGVWRRLRQVPLDVAHRTLDAQLPLRLGAPRARAAVAQWIVAGWRAYQRAGGLGSCERVDAATREYRARLDPLADWLAEGVRLGAGSELSGAVWAHYCAFMAERFGRAGGLPGPAARVTQRQFVGLLAEHGVRAVKGTGGARKLHGLTLIRPADRLYSVSG